MAEETDQSRRAADDPRRPLRQPGDPNIVVTGAVPSELTSWVRTGSATAAPTRFEAYILIAEPALRVRLWGEVDPGGRPRVRRLDVTAQDLHGSVSSTILRQLPVDTLLKMALNKVMVPATDRPEFGADAFQIPGDPAYQAWFSPPAESGVRGKKVPSDRVAQAAQIYAEALAAGSNAPGEVVRKALGYSRATAARDIRAARDRGLLPPLGQEPEPDATARLRGGSGRRILVDLSEFEAAAAEGRKRLQAEQEAEREAVQRQARARRSAQEDASE